MLHIHSLKYDKLSLVNLTILLAALAAPMSPDNKHPFECSVPASAAVVWHLEASSSPANHVSFFPLPMVGEVGVSTSVYSN